VSDRLLTARELAERLGVSVDVVYRHTGEWPVVRIGKLVRFDYDAVNAYRHEVDRKKRVKRNSKTRVGPFGTHSQMERWRVPGGWRIPIDNRFRFKGVYFVQPESGGLIKIGSSNDIGRRISEHQEGCPERLVILAAIKGADRMVEYDLHSQFHLDRVQGEWFDPSPELLAFIAEHREEAAA
jgi:excisionase family DNA binding protein